MDDKNFIFYPREIFLNINFDRVKNELFYISRAHKDFGSVMLLSYDDFDVTVSNIGKVDFIFNTYNEHYIDTLNRIESVFQKYIPQFVLNRN